MASGDDTVTIWLPRHVMRERATVPCVSLETLKHVRGYLVPRYVEEMPDGRRVAELREKDLQRVSDGYACGECLAFFDHRFRNCPGCGHELDPNRDIVEWSPPYWQPYEGRTSEQVLEETKIAP